MDCDRCRGAGQPEDRPAAGPGAAGGQGDPGHFCDACPCRPYRGLARPASRLSDHPHLCLASDRSVDGGDASRCLADYEPPGRRGDGDPAFPAGTGGEHAQPGEAAADRRESDPAPIARHYSPCQSRRTHRRRRQLCFSRFGGDRCGLWRYLDDPPAHRRGRRSASGQAVRPASFRVHLWRSPAPQSPAEEQRLAQAVAEGIARGGHVLLPCFGLGRGQEILLILRAAQERGQIPDFPLFVDGLVRRICSTYLLLPEALPPVLQRQIRRGYLPFSGGNIAFVRDERHREQILGGPPACLLSSSGMLTGGPSVWYAKRLASLENASILITGYQDEEAPGKRLLDLAEQKSSTLELDGATIPVRCRVAKFSLSAHADGGELAAYAAAVKPRQVALVHGDEEARVSLRRLLTETEVVLPENGSALSPRVTKGRQTAVPAEAHTLPALTKGIGQGRELTLDDLPQLWQVVSEIPALRIVTARLLASLWYGESGEEQTRSVLAVLGSDTEQRYFIHQQALEEAYRVRGQSEEAPGDFLGDLVGKLLLVEVSPGSTKPVLCQGIEPGARIRVQHPRGVDFVRTRYPFSAIIDLLGEIGR